MRRYSRNKLFDIAALAIFLSIFSFWFFDGLKYQGLNGDVALVGNAALGALINPDYSLEYHMGIFGGRLPLMVNEYNAATDIYAALPWVYLMGNTAMALHITGFIWAALSIILLYAVCMELSDNNRLYSSFACLLLVTSPSFIMASRLGLFTGNLTIFFALLSALLLLRWKKTASAWRLLLLGLSMGMGLAGKIQFLWFIAALMIYMVLKGLLGRGAAFWRNGLIIAAGIFSGAFFLVLANIRWGFFTVKFLARYLLVSRSGVPNTNYLSNLFERVKESLALVDGSAVSSSDSYNRLAICLPVLLGVSAIYFFISGYIIRRKLKYDAWALPLFLCILIILQSPFTPTILHSHHIVMILPFIYMAVCAPLSLPVKDKGLIRRGSWLCIISALIAGGYAFNNYLMLRNSRVHIRVQGGNEITWNVLSDVNDYLAAEGINRIGLGDAYIKDALLFLSKFKLELYEVYPLDYMGNTDAHMNGLAARLKAQRQGYYLFRTQNNAIVNFFDSFSAAASRCDKKVELLREFSSPEGDTIFMLYRVP
ncbi:MAG: glycosyltransferase family 39 protein [Candidatus Omnitrophica bacterium]|nr:glycosyltransferase family 39 protein [Candidatus Omnitrophota bacterium]